MRLSKFTLFLVASVVVSAFSQVLLKIGAKREYSSGLRQYLNFPVLSGYALMVLSTLLSMLAFHFGVAFKDSPVIESLGYVLVMVLSRIFFGEKITRRKLIGNLMIMAGIIIFYL